jgi:rhodanese-related sulfurtransferase
MGLRKLALFWLAMSLVGGVMLTIGCAATPGQVNDRITWCEAYDLVQENKDNPDFVILDVRTSEEFAAEHIENAVNINLNGPNFREAVNQLDKNKTYVVYCRTGVRAAEAAAIMKELGFKNVYDMGGIEAWKEAGYPTVR